MDGYVSPRFTGVPVAPAFFFMAGFMVALTSTGVMDKGSTWTMSTRHLLAPAARADSTCSLSVTSRK